MNQIPNPIIPFNGPIIGGMHPGKIIRVTGSVPMNAQKFAVNLLCGSSGDIALHISPDFHKNYVVRNYVQHMSWGHEEKSGHMPVRPGQSFEIIIFCEAHQYKIAFHGAHFAEFNHRLPYNSVTNVAIDGQVIISMISFEGSSGHSVGGFAPSAPFPAPGVVVPPMMGTAPYPNGPSYPGAHVGPYPAPSGPYPANPGSYPAPYPTQPGHAAPYPTQPGHAAPYPTQPGHAAPYPTQPGHVGAYPVQPGYPAHGAYPTQHGYTTKEQGTYYPHSPTHQKKGLLDKAGMAVAGAIGASALMGGKGGKLGKLAALGGGAGLAGAALTGHLSPKKAMKKQAKAHKKALKYGLPLAGAGIGAYALHKGLGHHKHFKHHGHSSSSSSSSDSD